MSFFDLFKKNNKNPSEHEADLQKKTQKQIVGRAGEDIACKYLKGKGHEIVDRNYLRKWGEIDIVTRKQGVIHFVEVKTVSRFFEANDMNVAHETAIKSSDNLLEAQNDYYRPEDNVHPWKLQRLGRVVQSYLIDKDVSDETEWQFDVATVYLNAERELLSIEILEDLVL